MCYIVIIKHNYILIMIKHTLVINTLLCLLNYTALMSSACPGGRGPRGLELQIEKQKTSSEQILSYFTYCYSFSRKCHFLCYFLSRPPPLEILKSKKKDKIKISPPPPLLRIPGHATVCK